MVLIIVAIIVGVFYLSTCQPAQLILLKEGTDSSQGVPQIISNINACQAIADAIRTTLGPRGMDKLIVDDKGGVCVKVLGCCQEHQVHVASAMMTSSG